VFAFLMFYAIDLLLGRRKDDVRATGFLALATLLPALTSVLMLTISLTKLGAICKLCAGVYISSALCLLGAIMLWRRAVTLGTAPEGPPTSNGFFAAMFGVGVLFVVVPIALYFAIVPDHGKFIGTCGQLDKPDDTYGVMVPVQRGGTAQALEILDPLCPACKAFEERLHTSGLADKLDRRAILFPLDTTCNWMITEDTHPGACVVSEAVLCAGDKAPDVLRWAFEVQDTVREQTKADPTAAERIVKQRFPELAACIGSPEAKSRLNKSLRWAVANNIRVLTPQLFVNNVKLCDEDVDIGLDYALSRMIDGKVPPPVQTAKPVEPAPAAPPPPAHTSEPKPATPQPADTTPSEGPVTTPTAEKPADTKPAATPPAEAKPADSKPADTKPADTKPADTKPAEPAAGTKPAEPPAEPKPADKPPLPPEEPAAPAGSNAGGAP